MSKRKLKPCPFCGCDKIGFKINGYFQPWNADGIKFWYSAYCYCCGASADWDSSRTMEKAIELWNYRGEDDD